MTCSGPVPMPWTCSATLVRAGASPLRLVGAYRDTEVRPTDPLGLLLADLAQARLVRQHTLGPLAPEDAAALLDDLLVDVRRADRGTAERVLQRAGGTPVLPGQLCAGLAPGGRGGRCRGMWRRGCASGWRCCRRRPGDPGCGGGGGSACAAHAARRRGGAAGGCGAGRPGGGLPGALLLEDGDDAYAFSHDVIREVVEADVGAARRAVLHRRVAEALEREPAGARPSCWPTTTRAPGAMAGPCSTWSRPATRPGPAAPMALPRATTGSAARPPGHAWTGTGGGAGAREAG